VSKSASRSAIVGVGYSKILRDKGIDGRPLAVEASRAAIADAGLRVRDVDAVFEYAGDEQAMDIARLVGIENMVVYGDFTPRGPSGLAAAMGAHMAVVSATCEVALVVRSVTREWGQMSGRALPKAAGPWQWEFPYGAAGGIIPVMGMKKQRRIVSNPAGRSSRRNEMIASSVSFSPSISAPTRSPMMSLVIALRRWSTCSWKYVPNSTDAFRPASMSTGSKSDPAITAGTGPGPPAASRVGRR